MKNLFAHTDLGTNYPAFISINRDDDGRHRITVRSAGNGGQSIGEMFVSPETLEHMATDVLASLHGDTQHPLDAIARVCHEVNRAYCQALGDDSQKPWAEAPEWQRVSARMGVDLHLGGDFGPEASHVAWMANKQAEGWKFGPVKDEAKKEHPCMVPFAELPAAQQAKDFIFRAVVHALKGGAA